MSVVAGCLPFNGVLLAADTRITYTRLDGTTIQVDHAQKIIPFTPGTALGFVGRVDTAAALLQALIHERDRRVRLTPQCQRRLHPMSVSLWMPRFLRWAFARLPRGVHSCNVAFMVASSYEHAVNVVDRQRIQHLLQHRLAHGAVLTSDLLFRLGWGSQGPARVEIPNTCRGSLYTLRPPLFSPVICPSLSFVAIGEGLGAIDSVDDIQDSILADQTGTGLGALLFGSAVSGYAERKRIASVGGLYPVLHLRGNSFELFGHHTNSYKRGGMELEAEVELVIEQDRWVQRNRLNGDCIPLRLPWELIEMPDRTHLFDYLDKRRKE